jgi:hypothetical protein
MTQVEFARHIGQYPEVVSRWEHGTNLPSLYWLLRIMGRCKCGVEDLLGPRKAWRKWAA